MILLPQENPALPHGSPGDPYLHQAQKQFLVPSKKLRIDISVGGRFHADHLASSFQNAGHMVRLLTSLPRSRFPDLKNMEIHSFIFPEIFYRLSRFLNVEQMGETVKMRAFGRRVERFLGKAHPPDLFVSWSSFALESFELLRSTKRILMRDSSHIRYQLDLLEREHERLGLPFRKNGVCLARELAEYDLADEVWLLSDFAKRTFLNQGFLPSKIRILRLGVDTTRFQPRIDLEPSKPLKVVYFGTLSVRKGVHYLLEAAKKLAKHIDLSLVGAIEHGFGKVLQDFPDGRYLGPMPQGKLADFLKKMDVFVFPTLEDGFGQTLLQAMASGLVPIATDHCGAADFVRDGENGFLVPAGNSEALEQALLRCCTDSKRLPQLKQEAVATAKSQTWSRYSNDAARLLVEPPI